MGDDEVWKQRFIKDTQNPRKFLTQCLTETAVVSASKEELQVTWRPSHRVSVHCWDSDSIASRNLSNNEGAQWQCMGKKSSQVRRLSSDCIRCGWEEVQIRTNITGDTNKDRLLNKPRSAWAAANKFFLFRAKWTGCGSCENADRSQVGFRIFRGEGREIVLTYNSIIAIIYDVVGMLERKHML